MSDPSPMTPAPSVDASPDGLDLSPSVVHRRLMRENRPELAYDGSEPVAAWQNQLRPRFAACLGYDRVLAQPRCDLNPRTLWRREHELGTIEKLAYTAEPGADVVGYLCLPKGQATPHPCFVCLQGHSPGMHLSIGLEKDEQTEMREVPGDRDFGLTAMRAGVAALCIEQRAFGQREENIQKRGRDYRCEDTAMHALMLGRTLAAERVLDVARGIDLLQDRPEIDASRLGAMGNSGGGLIALYAAALDDRLGWVMPSCGFCTYEKSIMSITHCVDNFIPGLLRLAEMADVAGLIAPRPMVMVAGKEDPIFPIDGVHEAFAQLQRIYKDAGAADRCKLVVGPAAHRFYAEAGWSAMARLAGFGDG